MAEYRRDSVYRNTNTVDEKYLDVWEPGVDYKNIKTETYVIENKYHQRPDSLANALYGNAKLWWIFAIVNQDKLNDPIFDFEAGLEIQVPLRFT